MSTPIGDHGNELADEGKVFVCFACGKLSKDRYGDQRISRGWDESCMLNSNEVAVSRLEYSDDGLRVVKVKS